MDYEKGYKKQVKKNNKEVLNQLDSKSMKIKIDNFADKHGYNPKEVKENIKNNEMFRSVFAKDPAKQNFYQNKAAEYIKSMNNVKNFEVLPTNGDNAKYIVNGNILEGKNLKNKNQEAKSIDFYFESGKHKIYASHKYTKNEGGAQDNQYKDVQAFLNNSRYNNLKDTKFIAICDGDYYQNKNSKSGDDTRIEQLQRLTDNKNVFVTDIDGLDSVLKNLE